MLWNMLDACLAVFYLGALAIITKIMNVCDGNYIPVRPQAKVHISV